MMGYGFGGMMGSSSILGLITWFALIAFLVLGAMYFWKQINHPRK